MFIDTRRIPTVCLFPRRAAAISPDPQTPGRPMPVSPEIRETRTMRHSPAASADVPLLPVFGGRWSHPRDRPVTLPAGEASTPRRQAGDPYLLRRHDRRVPSLSRVSRSLAFPRIAEAVSRKGVPQRLPVRPLRISEIHGTPDMADTGTIQERCWVAGKYFQMKLNYFFSNVLFQH